MRLCGYKIDDTAWLNDIGHYRTSFEILKHGDAQIILIENCSRGDKFELEFREGQHIENNRCVNRYRPIRTNKQYREENLNIIRNKEHHYRINNPEKVKEQDRFKYQNITNPDQKADVYIIKKIRI